jgi:transcriptional regulator with XRE-family HTH domain
MNGTAVTIANKVRGVAAERRCTQGQLAETLGLSRTAVVDRLNGRVPFSAPEIHQLSEQFDVPVSRFFPERAA